MKYDLIAGLFKTFVATVVVTSALLVAVNSIPNASIADHVRRSMSPVNYQRSPTGLAQIDYFTECVAATMGLGASPPMSALRQAFLSPTLFDCEKAKVAFESGRGGENYWRYWHGYQVISRPFLYFFGLPALRTWVFLGFCISAYMFVESVRNRVGTTKAAFVLVSLLCVPIYSALYLISHGLVWIIAFLAGAWLLQTARDDNHLPGKICPRVFLFLGMITAFVDILTTPLITLTIPLLALYWRGNGLDGGSWRRSWIATVLLCFAWAVGYAGFWSMKWAIAFLLYNVDVVGGAIGTVLWRLSGKVDWTEISVASSIRANLWEARYGLVALAGFLLFRTVRCIWVQGRWAVVQPFRSRDEAMTYAIIFGLPLVWFIALRNHSVIHAWFVAPILYPTLVLGFWLVHEAVGTRSARLRVG